METRDCKTARRNPIAMTCSTRMLKPLCFTGGSVCRSASQDLPRAIPLHDVEPSCEPSNLCTPAATRQPLRQPILLRPAESTSFETDEPVPYRPCAWPHI